jgi:hypothetical protein
MDIMDDLFSLQGKNAVVLGAGGMGTAIASGLLRHGAQLAVAERDAAALERCTTQLSAAGHTSVRTHEVDATDETSMQALVDAAVADMGRVDILVNALGYNFKAHATEFPMDEWDRLFSVNVKAVMLACKLFGAHMIEQGRGKIINLSSVRDDRGALGGRAGALSRVRERARADHHRDPDDRRAHQAGLIAVRAHAAERADGAHGRRGGSGRPGRVPGFGGIGLHHRHRPVRGRRHDGLRLMMGTVR